MRIAAALLWCLAAPALAGVPEPEGFRGEPYRAEVPATVMGQPGLSPEEARALHARGVPFLDVLPHAARPEGLPEGTVWREKPHLTIPGATWLPNTGYEALAEPDAAYLRQGLERATGGDPAADVVVFCKQNCWMSWNVAKRAMEWGYSGIHWFPGGVEAWQDLGGDLEEVLPAPR
ncbi:PQQ-dependent catabolism-associated CXXCW motif protein [Cereibacter johrii]|uniref:PQQ-dependent catabolism-associated CXXCW motif protein n=1 Tax=Cereibacter johrii TaxID=445629 RepID=UPI002B258390|nr:PQQ-dependent catabolism-associated CXXCW motif protein [Cereibacter johrii]MEA5162386.1 PQQ-dependent catabolism-associated CXXCW motif protein [Cereibacter johrii]